MEIVVAEQGLFLLPVKVTADQAREKAWEQKLNVFGTFSKLLMRPKGDEIQVSLLELRYQPFWHAASRKHFRYDRRAANHPPPRPGVEHCRWEEHREIFLDGLTGEAQDLRTYLAFDRIVPDEQQPLPRG